MRSFSQLFGKKTLSYAGKEMYMIEITDFKKLGDEIPVVASLSVHGQERAGIEGGLRYAEDLVRWVKEDPTHELRNGTNKDSTALPVKRVLDDVHLYLACINPDGWAFGDTDNGGIYLRGNGNGVDLNREFPTEGWTSVGYTPLSEPEAIAWTKLAKRISPDVASDIHGQATSPDNAFTDIMYTAAEWDPLELIKVERLARHMKSNVERYFEAEGIALPEGIRPAEYATGYDVVGYDDSGFMGDWFTEKLGALGVDVEHTLTTPTGYVAANAKAHVEAVRAEIETLIVEALVEDSVDLELNLGRLGYVFDPKRITSKDGYGGPKPPKRSTPQSYDVTRMRFFDHIARYTTRRPVRFESGNITPRSLKRVDSLVIAGRAFPPDPDGDPVRRKKIARTLKEWVKAGGNLVLTDAALRLLPKLGIVDASEVSMDLHGAGHVDIEDFDDPYTRKVHQTASQTYFEVPLGYSVNEDTSPHYSVDRSAWEASGGKTIAHISDSERVGLGRLKFGKGTIGIFGALLPDPTEKFDHLFGLANYAVTVAGFQIITNMISALRNG